MFLNINNKSNITLCGMMGSGKSTIGRLMGKKINYNFYDIDKLIEEKTQKSITEIFREEGEEYFRNLEEEITINILNSKKTIIALGGGAILNDNIRTYIKRKSYNIYLEVNKKNLKKRLSNSKNRPLIKNENYDKILNDLIKKREKFYKKADLTIKNDNTIDDTIKKIIKILSYE